MPDVTTETEWRDAPAHPQDSYASPRRQWWGGLAADQLTAIYGLWIAVALIYWPSSLALGGIWRGSSGNAYTHGYLVLAASLWLIARDREGLRATPVRPVGWAWVPVVVLSVLWLWSWRAAIQTLHVVLLPVILLTSVVAALGWRAGRKCVFPVGFLLFAIPIWEPINHGLQTASAELTAVMVFLAGIPVYLQGDLIRLPAGTIEIAQACAGLNGVIIGLTVAALYGEIVRDSLRRRLLWLALMGTLALVANGVRIFIVTVAAYQTEMRSSLVTHHIWLGWVTFAIAVGLFLVIAERLGDFWDRRRPREVSTVSGWPERPTDAPRRPIGGVRAPRLWVTLACMGLFPALSYAMDFARSTAQSGLIIEWPEAPLGWRGPVPDTLGGWSPRFVDPSAESLQLYVDSRAEPIEVFAAAYRTQSQEGKLLGYRNNVLGGPDRLQARSQAIVDSPAGRWLEIVAIDTGGARSLIWWRYKIANRVFTKPRLSQLWYGLEALTGSPPVSSLTALRTGCAATCSAARERLSNVAAGLQPVVTLRPAREAKAR